MASCGRCVPVKFCSRKVWQVCIPIWQVVAVMNESFVCSHAHMIWLNETTVNNLCSSMFLPCLFFKTITYFLPSRVPQDMRTKRCHQQTSSSPVAVIL